jgi:hypothetical protein
LNISLKKDVFRCPRCGVSGGIFDLYSLYTGVPRDKVYKTLLRTMGKGQTEQPKTVPVPHPPIVEAECPITDVDTRHATYTAFLSKLSLAQDHRENLLGRGLTDEEIVRLTADMKASRERIESLTEYRSNKAVEMGILDDKRDEVITKVNDINVSIAETRKEIEAVDLLIENIDNRLSELGAEKQAENDRINSLAV